MATERNCASTS